LIRALTCDVFGTVVDWHAGIIEEGLRLEKTMKLDVDWDSFALAWRFCYQSNLNRIQDGELPWMDLDELNRMVLDELLLEFKITGLDESGKEHLNNVWHRLKPWPDSVDGITRLRKKFSVLTLSNGDVALMTDVAQYGKLPWSHILSAASVKHYKPSKEVYQMAVDFLKLRPEQILMVAAHEYDLRAARAVGFKTAFVRRPLEYGVKSSPVVKATFRFIKNSSFNFVVNGFNDLADQLGC